MRKRKLADLHRVDNWCEFALWIVMCLRSNSELIVIVIWRQIVEGREEDVMVLFSDVLLTRGYVRGHGTHVEREVVATKNR